MHYGLRPVAQLMIGEVVDTESLAKGYLADVYKYSTVPFNRALYVTHDMIGDVDTYNGDAGQDLEALRLSNQIGADAVKKEHYDILIAELRRGVSGDYAIPYPFSPKE